MSENLYLEDALHSGEPTECDGYLLKVVLKVSDRHIVRKLKAKMDRKAMIISLKESWLGPSLKTRDWDPA